MKWPPRYIGVHHNTKVPMAPFPPELASEQATQLLELNQSYRDRLGTKRVSEAALRLVDHISVNPLVMPSKLVKEWEMPFPTVVNFPNVSKRAWWTYQRGEMYGYQNLKQFVLHRDHYLCQSCKKKTKNNTELHVHHILFRSNDYQTLRSKRGLSAN